MKIAAFQERHAPGQFQNALSQVRNQLLECNASKVEVALFPECHLTGYFLRSEDVMRHAISFESAEFQQVRDATSRIRTTAILGFLEKRGSDFFNTAAVVRDGELLGCYRKIHTNERALTPGVETPTFVTGDVRFGINICNDANYPETALRTTQGGVQVLFYPLNNFLRRAVADEWRPKSPVNLVNRAMETGCWVVSSDVIGDADGWLSHGCTMIVSPRGEVINRAPEGETTTVMAELSFLQ
jgi:5-aminopentanamidase